MASCILCMYWTSKDYSDWDADNIPDDDDKIGECSKYAPRPVMMGQMNKKDYYVCWPETTGGTWCGDFDIDDSEDDDEDDSY